MITQTIDEIPNNGEALPFRPANINLHGFSIDVTADATVNVSECDIELEQFVRGVAQLNDRIYILFNRSRLLHVYDATTLNIVEKRQLDAKYGGKKFRLFERHVLECEDIVACSTNQCLYLSDGTVMSESDYGLQDEDKMLYIWKLLTKESSKGSLWLKWKVIDCTGRRLSVTAQGNVLIVDNSIPPSVLIFSSNATMLCTVKLPEHMKQPRHAILNDCQLIVSHESEENHRVCKFEITAPFAGNRYTWIDNRQHFEQTVTLRSPDSYGQGQGNNDPRLNGPAYITVDNHGRIYLADYHSSRVIVFNSNLTKLTTLLCDGNGVLNPYRVHWINERLLVALHDKKRIKVYSFTSS